MGDHGSVNNVRVCHIDGLTWRMNMIYDVACGWTQVRWDLVALVMTIFRFLQPNE